MKLAADLPTLNEAAIRLKKMLPTANTQPELKCFLLAANKNTLELYASDGTTGLQIDLPAEVKEPGEALILGEKFKTILNGLPGDKVELSLKDGETRLEVKQGRSKYKLDSLNPELFPLPPAMTETPIEIPGTAWKEALTCLYAVATDDSKGVLQGLRLLSTPDGIDVYGINGHRMAMAGLPYDLPGLNCVIPGDVLKGLRFSEAPVFLTFDPAQISIRQDNWELVTRQMVGEYPPLRQMMERLPKPPHRARINRKEIVDALKRLKAIARIVSLHFTTQSLTLEDRERTATEEIDCFCTTTGTVKAQIKYLLECLEAVSGDVVEITFGRPTDPIRVEDLHFVHILSPIVSDQSVEEAA